jgi:superfamily II DNA or RNA helicase
MARRLTPDEDPDAAPGWLRPEQVRSFRRALHAIRRHGGAMLADPVGSGKTYVALAVATALEPHRPPVCLVPATLLQQWRSTARSLGITIAVASHEAASRGRLPPARRGLVIVDEAHHFRNPATWRYRHTAPWLVGRRVLLVTATPVVNRLADLLHQLLLAIRDDALAAEGVASLRALLGRGQASPALGELVIESAPSEGQRPARRSVTSRSEPGESSSAEATLASLDRLRLSRVPGTEALLRTVLRCAAASSPAALSAALRRYRNLLLHARDAASAGRPPDRAAIRRFAGELEDQLVWWELMPGSGDSSDLSLEDLDAIGEVLRESARAEGAPDAKVERLRTLIADGKPTLVFTSRRETVRYLRDRLAPPALAWCTGVRAGLGPCPLPRATVLGWFREPSAEGPPARHLIATDVAAEGLDLQRAARVVHYDLPWTPMRLEQREGRAVRLGSSNPTVEVVTFSPPAAVDGALRMTRALAQKAQLPSLAGLGLAGRGLWRWRAELAELYAGGPASPGVAVVPRGPAGVLALFELYELRPSAARRLSATLVWVDQDGGWTEEESVVAARLAAASESPAAAGEPARLKAALELLGKPIRARLSASRGSRWSPPAADPVAHQLSSRLHCAVRDAARRRDLEAMAGLERALAFVDRGHTSGERLELERLAALPAGRFEREVTRMPVAEGRWSTIAPRLVGVLLFIPS